MKTGYIYGYYDAMTQAWVYVGQSVNLTLRHKRHLQDLHSRFDRELKHRNGTPDAFVGPVVLETITAPKAEYPQATAFQETMWMFHLHTYYRAYERGFNLCIPLSVDYENLGRLGGSIAVHLIPRAAKIRGGQRSGRKAVESGQLDNMRKLPQTKEAHRRNGKALGREAVDSGRLARLRTVEHQVIAASAAGRCAVENQKGIFAVDSQGQLIFDRHIIGLISGQKHAALKTGVCGRSPEQMRIDGRKGGFARAASMTPEERSERGRFLGRKNIDSGHIYKLNHLRWHINRGIVNPNCKLCANRQVA